MTDKLEALSQPVGYVGKNCRNSVASGNLGYIKPNDAFGEDPVYSKEYVTALLAALEEKDQRIVELEQRLQQPIKLPIREIGMACEFLSEHVVVSLATVMVEAATAGFKAEVEGE